MSAKDEFENTYPDNEKNQYQQNENANNINDIDDYEDEAGMKIVAQASAFEEALLAGRKEGFNIAKEIKEWVFAIAFALVITFLIKGFVFDIVKVEGQSMEPTLMNNDRLILTKLGYKPKAGDIIVLDAHYKNREAYIQRQKEAKGSSFTWFDELKLRLFPPKSLNLGRKYYVKRVIAMPGDVIDIDPRNGDVTVNGVLLNEPYIRGQITRPRNDFPFPYKVEDDCVFVMGDNRNNSSDSRVASLGTVPLKAISGKAVFRIWPFESFGGIY